MLLNVVLVWLPTDVTATKQTVTISTNMTAYSTAVGPSSEARNRRTRCAKVFIWIAPGSLLRCGSRLRPIAC
jgi:hypothetical protein